MSNMTFPCVNTIQLGPSPFNSSPQCKKSSLCHHFKRNSWIGWKKVTCTCSFLHVIFLFLVSTSPGPYFGQKVPHSLPSNTQKMPKMAEYGPKMAKNGLWKIAVTLTFTINRKIIAGYFLQLFTYSDRFRDMAVWSWNSCGSDFPNEFIDSVQLN